jgi:hypothetical protein
MGHSRDETASLAGVCINCISGIDRIAIGLSPEPIDFEPWQPGRVWLGPFKSLDVAGPKTSPARRKSGLGSLSISR